jgi:RNA polymerase sigma-70 factor (ECF subfamily)
MTENIPEQMRGIVDAVYSADSRRIFATLIRLLGDVDIAEEALHDAFTAAVEQWPRDGVPANPRAWLVSTGRFKAIDSIRRRALPPDARLALTLREVCGLTTEEIARAFLIAAPTIAKRIVRAKAKIRDARIPYEVPSRGDLCDRLDPVLHAIYLLFTEGYSASSGVSLTRPDISGDAIRLGRLLAELLPEPEVLGLLGLMLLHESRRAARISAEGELVLLDDQDRSLWNQDQIAEGTSLAERVLYPHTDSARTPFKRLSRRCMLKPPMLRRRTGLRSSDCTTYWHA